VDRRARLALCGSLLAATALGLGALAALRWGPAHQLDASALTGFVALRSSRLGGVCDTIVHLGDVGPYAVAGVALIVGALVRGRQRTAVAIAALLGIAPLTTEVLLKPLLAVPRIDPALGAGQIAPASFPSGHATAAMTIALCLVVAAGPSWRPVAATVGAGLAVVVSYALITLGWHYPSDVLGGYLVATAWTLLAVAVLRMGPERRLRPARPRGRLAVTLAPAGAAALAAGAVGALLAARPGAALFAQEHKAAIAVAGGMGAAALALAAGLALELRR